MTKLYFAARKRAARRTPTRPEERHRKSDSGLSLLRATRGGRAAAGAKAAVPGAQPWKAGWKGTEAKREEE